MSSTRRKWIISGAVAVVIAAIMVVTLTAQRPVVFKIPNGPTLKLIGVTYGNVDVMFPDPNPLKRLWQSFRPRLPLIQQAKPQLRRLDEESAIFWFEEN